MYPRKSFEQLDCETSAQMQHIHRTGEESLFPKLCSHEAVIRKSRRQFSCLAKDPDDRSTSIWRFLSWVAYSRSVAGPQEITHVERRRCPLIWCRVLLDDQDMLLDHVFTCAHLSDGRYWCYHCQREERFAPFQCKHCQIPPFRKDRLSMRAKRIFRWLGTRSHQKTIPISETSSSRLGRSAPGHQCFEIPPVYCERSRDCTELSCDGATAELGGASTAAELSGYSRIRAELDAGNQPQLAFKSGISALSEQSAGKYSERHGTSVARPNEYDSEPQSSFGFHVPISRFNPRVPFESAGSTATLGSLSPVSPSSPGWMEMNDTDATTMSPTETVSSTQSICSKPSEITNSSISTQSSYIPNFGHSSLTYEMPADEVRILPGKAITVEEPNQEYLRQPGWDVLSPVSVQPEVPATIPECMTVYEFGSSSWLTPEDLIRDFWSVMKVHVKESIETLRLFQSPSVIRDLLSMTPESITSRGLSTWQFMLNGYLPTKIADFFALLHVAYACAIIIHDGQPTSQLEQMFSHALVLEAGVLSRESQVLYKMIVEAIWLPHDKVHSPLDMSHADFIQDPAHVVRPLYDTPSKRGNSMTCLTPIFATAVCSDFKEAPAAIQALQSSGNKVLMVLGHFSNLIEGMSLYNKISSLDDCLSHNTGDDDFIHHVKDNITSSLMKASFEAAPSLEAFVNEIALVEKLVSMRRIASPHDLEIILTWAGRRAAKSLHLYEIYWGRVKDLCSSMPGNDRSSQNKKHIECVAEVKRYLSKVQNEDMQAYPDLKRQYASSGRHDSCSLASQRINALNLNSNSLSEHNVSQRQIQRRSAIKRKRTASSRGINGKPPSSASMSLSASMSSSSSASTLTSMSTSPSALLQSAQDSLVCGICGHQPRGDPKWHRNNMGKHLKIHREEDERKSFPCPYPDCEKSYGRSDNLGQHIRTKHSKNRRLCSPDNVTAPTQIHDSWLASSPKEVNNVFSDGISTGRHPQSSNTSGYANPRAYR